MSMKVNMKGFSTTVRSLKQESKEIKEGVVKIESHMKHYNVGMGTLTNFVKVIIPWNFPFIIVQKISVIGVVN